MWIGLILRGWAFKFRAKAPIKYKRLGDRAFFAGSLITALSQGFMLGIYIMGLELTAATLAFAAVTGICLTVGFSFIGATWLLIKTDGALQAKAASWSRRSLWGILGGIGAVSIASPLVSPRIFEKWVAVPEVFFLAPLPISSALLLGVLWLSLRHLPDAADRWSWIPFVSATGLFALAFAGLAYSFYPYVVPEKLTIYESASAPESLFIILVGVLFVLPAIIGYTVLSYVIFRGTATALRYD